MMMCICRRDQDAHRPDCPITLAFKFRCPECRSRKRADGHITHSYHCPFKGFDHRRPT